LWLVPKASARVFPVRQGNFGAIDGQQPKTLPSHGAGVLFLKTTRQQQKQPQPELHRHELPGLNERFLADGGRFPVRGVFRSAFGFRLGLPQTRVFEQLEGANEEIGEVLVVWSAAAIPNHTKLP
jgi:hypothetical protein